MKKLQISEHFSEHVQFFYPEIYSVSIKTVFTGVSIGNNLNGILSSRKLKEVMFNLQRPYPLEIYSNFHYYDARSVLILGNMGEGKTTLLRYYCQAVASGQILELTEIKLVLFVDCKDLEDERQYLWDFIYGSVCPDSEHCHELFKWMINNNKNIMFVFDSFEKLNISSFSQENCDYYCKSKPLHFILSILSEDLFKNSKILLSSRHYGIKNLPQKCRPQRCLILNGLPSSKVKLAIQEVTKKYPVMQKSFQYIDISTFSSNPWFLNIILKILIKNTEMSSQSSCLLSLLLSI